MRVLGQEPTARATLLAPRADQQPSSPWSKPFSIHIPGGQPPPHVVTQHDLLDEATSEDRVPEVALFDPPRIERNHRVEQRLRATLASRISQEVLTPTVIPSSRPIEPLENPPGWASTEQSLRCSLDRCDHLLRRGAVHSARQEVLTSLRQLFRGIDLHRRTWESEPVFQQGWTALKESEDFERTAITEPTSVHRIVQSHQTAILQETRLDLISPAIASQHYRAYARDAFLTAVDRHPWGADLLYALGKTYEKEAQQQPERQVSLLQHATVCFQAAHMVDPKRHHIANQLGFTLLQLDRVGEALVALHAAIASQASVNAFQNLAEAYRRTGQVTQMQDALAMASSLAANEIHYSPDRPEITEITPEEFARISPPPSAYELHQAPSKITSRSLLPQSMR